MALIIKTSTPIKLLSEIKSSIDSKKIETWEYDADGDFTHTPAQWKYKGWMRPQTHNNELRFIFVGSNSFVTTKLLYAIYHGRLAEMLLNHFDDRFTDVTATALPSGDVLTDKIK